MKYLKELIGWFKRFYNKLQIEWARDEALSDVDLYIRKYWDIADTTYHAPNTYTKDNLFTKKFHLSNGWKIEFFRGFRGDLIEVYNTKGKLMVGWVDQSHQYKSLGRNDITMNISPNALQDVMKLVRKWSQMSKRFVRVKLKVINPQL